MTWNPTRTFVPHICVTSVPGSKFQSASLYGQSFWVAGHFETKCTKWPQTDLEPYQITVPYMCCPRVPNFTPFRSTASHFWDIGHFEKSALNDPKMTLNLQGQRSLIYVLIVSPSLKFHPIILYGQPFSRYKVVDNLKMIPEWPWIVNCQKYIPCIYIINDLKLILKNKKYKIRYIYEVLTHEAQIFVRFALRPAVFKIQGYWKRKFRKCTEWPQTDFEILPVKSASHTSSNCARGPNFGPISDQLYDQGFSRYKVDENRKCTELLRTELEHLTVKIILYAQNTYPWGPNFGPFRSTTN